MENVRVFLDNGSPGVGVYMLAGGGVFGTNVDVQGRNGDNQVGWWIETPAGLTFDTFSLAGSSGSGDTDYGFVVNGTGATYNIQVVGGGFDGAGAGAVVLAPAAGGNVSHFHFTGLHHAGSGPRTGTAPHAGIQILTIAGSSVSQGSWIGGQVQDTQAEAIKLDGAGAISHIMFSSMQLFDGSRAGAGLYRVYEASGATNLTDIAGPNNQVWNNVSTWKTP